MPLLTGGFTASTGTTTDPVVADSGAATPTVNLDQKFPQAIIAQETISSTLDTERKRIMADYTFEELGAISIGQFSQGVSGELDISQDGITAKNINGDTTFDIDGATGNATFSGKIKAGDIEVVDENGLVSLQNFLSDNVDGGLFDTISTSDADIPGMTLTTPSLIRPTHTIIFFTGSVYGTQNSGPGTSYSGETALACFVNGSPVSLARMRNTFNSSNGQSNADITTISSHAFITLPAGVSTIKLTLRALNTNPYNNYRAAGVDFKLSYMTLGR